jgi:hypothetical protein
LTQGSDLDTAIQYARHATAIESHPYPWTTLASILVRKMEAAPSLRGLIFPEIMGLLKQVFDYEAKRGWRPTPHPYATLFHCVTVFLDIGGVLALGQKDWVVAQIDRGVSAFARDEKLQTNAHSLLRRL